MSAFLHMHKDISICSMTKSVTSPLSLRFWRQSRKNLLLFCHSLCSYAFSLMIVLIVIVNADPLRWTSLFMICLLKQKQNELVKCKFLQKYRNVSTLFHISMHFRISQYHNLLLCVLFTLLTDYSRVYS